jgi:hypothetical protein
LRREWSLRRAALERQTPDVSVSADFDSGEPFQPLGAKKLPDRRDCAPWPRAS